MDDDDDDDDDDEVWLEPSLGTLMSAQTGQQNCDGQPTVPRAGKQTSRITVTLTSESTYECDRTEVNKLGTGD
jgi:hypothetical protein